MQQILHSAHFVYFYAFHLLLFTSVHRFFFIPAPMNALNYFCAPRRNSPSGMATVLWSVIKDESPRALWKGVVPVSVLLFYPLYLSTPLLLFTLSNDDNQN